MDNPEDYLVAMLQRQHELWSLLWKDSDNAASVEYRRWVEDLDFLADLSTVLPVVRPETRLRYLFNARTILRRRLGAIGARLIIRAARPISRSRWLASIRPRDLAGMPHAEQSDERARLKIREENKVGIAVATAYVKAGGPGKITIAQAAEQVCGQFNITAKTAEDKYRRYQRRALKAGMADQELINFAINLGTTPPTGRLKVSDLPGFSRKKGRPAKAKKIT